MQSCSIKNEIDYDEKREWEARVGRRLERVSEGEGKTGLASGFDIRVIVIK